MLTGLNRYAGRGTWLQVACGVLGLVTLTGCPGSSQNPVTAIIPTVNRPPSVQILSPSTSITVESGQMVTIAYTGEDDEDIAQLTIVMDKDQTPNNGNEIVVRNDLTIGKGQTTGQAQWDTTGVAAGTYYPFLIANDGTNPAVIVTSLGSIQIVPTGTNPLTSPPALQFLEPVSNLGVASGDTVTLRYRYKDLDSPVKVTLMLDKDRDPTNDDVNNPGDPLDPASNIIILPSEVRHADDPVLPPDVVGQPPAGADSIQIRTNPRTFPAIPTGGFSSDKLFLFTIDFAKIPVRQDGKPYFLRATINDGSNPPVHQYAITPLTVTGLASGFVDLANVGVNIAGTKFQGFSTNEHLGSQILDAGDSDNDSINDFMLVGRYASPRNRFLSGAAYLIRGRRKLPFPTTDDNTNGLPDQRDSNGNIVDFPTPPLFISRPPFWSAATGPIFPTPYNPVNVGRFGGTVSINSVGSLFRGTTFAMPQPNKNDLPPAAQQSADVPGIGTSGLVSVARIDMTGDGVLDYVFGIPFVSQARDAEDDDPCDGMSVYQDGYPNAQCENGITDDDIVFHSDTIDQGMVICVSGANDVENDGSANSPFGHVNTPDGVIFRLVVDAGIAGQFDPRGFTADDEGIIETTANTPVGFRFRGGWFTDNGPPIDSNSEYGATVSRIPSYDNDLLDELAVSVPADAANTGRVDVWKGTNVLGVLAGDNVASFPQYACAPGNCNRTFWAPPVFISLRGKSPGDRFGNCRPAGQFNQDGVGDLLAGAPGASVDGLTGNGITYIFLTPAGGFGDANLATENVPRVEIHGTHNGDHFGFIHDAVGDMNGDGIDDVVIASPNFSDDLLGNANAGYVGVIFGNRPITGEKVFSPDQIGTPSLSGVRFLGPTAGALAGSSVSTAGDFNQDGYGDLLIAAPGEIRVVNGEERLGVAYLVFGGPHLINKAFNLSQVGSPQLPGVVFVSPYVKGTVDQATLETVGGVGDVDGDGFDDICIGAPHADFVDTASPNQRRVDAGEVWLVYGSNFGTNKLP